MEDENGFHVQFTDPDTGEFVSRVSGFRNGNSVFLNQLRFSKSAKYSNANVVEACKLIATDIISSTKDSSTPVENVFISGDYSMSNSGLKTINFPASLQEIRSMAFYECTSLSGNLEFNEGLTTIGFDAFGYCESITGVKLPNSLTSLEGRAFEFCTGITSFIFGSGITSLESNAVRGLHSLEYLYLPATITSVQGFGIYECENLKTLVIASETRISFPQYTLESCPSIERICVPEDLVDDYQNYFSNSSLHGRLAYTIEAI